MRAIGLIEYGGPEVLREVDLPAPQPGPGEVRIQVHAAGVNPTDTMLRAGAHAAPDGPPPPYVPGMDVAGVVDALGAEVDGRLHEGQRVVALVVPRGSRGAYAEQVVVPAASVVAAPEGVDDAAAATLLMNALTAQVALDVLAVPPGRVVAVTGAAGAVGGYAVQLGVADGLRVIADAAPRDEELVRGLGATEVVARGDDVAQRIRDLVPDGVQGLVDGAVLHEKVLAAIADGGGLAVVRSDWSGPSERGIAVHPVLVGRNATDTAALTRLVGRAERGELTLRVAEVLPARDATKAHQRLEAGGVRGRIVLDVTDWS